MVVPNTEIHVEPKSSKEIDKIKEEFEEKHKKRQGLINDSMNEAKDVLKGTPNKDLKKDEAEVRNWLLEKQKEKEAKKKKNKE